MLLKEIILRQQYNDEIALIYGSEKIKYSNFFILINKNINIIKMEKLNLSNNVGIFIHNSINYAISYFIITCLNKTIVPLSIYLKKEELLSNINYCEINIIITDNLNIEILEKYLEAQNKEIFIYNIDSGRFIFKTGLKIKYEKIINLTEQSVAIMLPTSGTTNSPKRVMLTHKNLISNIISNIKSLKLTNKDIGLISLPMFFGYCNTAQFLTHLFLGASVVIMRGFFLPSKFFKIIEKEKITNFTAVPTMLMTILEYEKKYHYKIDTLKYICFGGGIIPKEKLRMLIMKFPNIGFIQTYGQTEASPRITCLLPEYSLDKIGSVGKPIPNVLVKIINTFGKEVIPGEIGELILTGENVMKGYYKNEKETKKVLKNNYLYTGDYATYDNDGFIYLKGRKKNIIICGGINIYPEEIEEHLIQMDGIEVCLVHGEKNEFWGEVPVARIVLKKDNLYSEEEIKQFCIEKLPNNKIPHKIYLVKKLKKTITGKVNRNL